MNFGYYVIHEVSLNSDCYSCFKKWPKDNRKYTRAQCKRQNWNGYVDINRINDFTHEQLQLIKHKVGI
jgi:hypothetical protein